MKKFTKKITVGLIILMVLFTSITSVAEPVRVYGRNRTVKVGFFEYPGYHEEKNGVRSGLGYDFLTLLRRYTNLNFEYVGYDKCWEEMQEMLKNGEIDLLTSARKTCEREKCFDYSEPIGTNNAQINVRTGDERFTPGDYEALNGITIGELAGNSRNADVSEFAADKGFEYKIREYDTADELSGALAGYEVDAIATSSLRRASGEKTVAEFAPEEFYCIVRKGDKTLLNEINYGISQMDLNEGNWRDNLYYNNYVSDDSASLSFSAREKEYIEAVRRGDITITAAAQPDADPYSFTVDGELTGIIPDYFAHLMNMAGLPYTTLVAKDRSEFRSWVVSNYADVIIDFRFGSVDSEIEELGLVTDPYLELTSSRVTRKGFTGKARKVAYVDSWGIKALEEDLAEDAEIIQYPSREAVLRAVLSGEADVCCVYTYTAEKFINTDPTSTLQANVLNSPIYDEYIYVSPDADHELCSILNKCIKADTGGIIDSYVKKYTTVTYDDLSLWHYLKLHPGFIYLGFIFLMALAGLVVFSISRGRNAEIKSNQLKKELSQQQKLDEALTFANFFLDTFASAYFVNLDTTECQVYKKRVDWDQEFPPGCSYLAPFTERITRCTHPDDREGLLAAIQPEAVKEALEKNNEFLYIFRDISGETEKMYKMQVIRGASASQAAFGFVDITEEYREQGKRLLGAVPLSLDVLTKANIGLWAFELDEGKAPRMYVDDTMLGLIGLDHQVPPEETYHAWYDHVEEGSCELVNDAVAKMIAGEHAEVQYPWIHPDGRTMIVRCGGVRNYEYTEGIRVEGTHQNVTEVLHFQEEKLQKNQQIIEILASEYTSVYYIDLRTEELETYTMNEETETEFGHIFRKGIKYSDAFRMYVASLVFKEDRDKMLEAGAIDTIRAELTDKKAYVTTYRSENAGQPHYCEMKFVKVGESEHPTAVALGFADKNDEIRDEMLRKAIAARDAAVISGLSDDFGCVVYVDYTTGYEVHYRFDPLLSASVPGWESISNFDERMKTLTDSLMLPEDREYFQEPGNPKAKIMDIVNREGVFYRTFRVKIGDDIKYYQLKIIRDENSANHIIAGLRNVDDTAKKELEYKEKLEAANKSKTDFLFNMSHDIRTPMNAIIGFTQLAKKHLDDPEKIIDSLDKIELSGNHLLELINEVLDMSRVEAGKLHSDMKNIVIADEAERLMTICRESAEEHDITIEHNLKNIAHPVVYADELHINQILLNIVSNSIKYSLPGGKILFDVEETNSDVPGYGKFVFTVKDTGIGMAPDFLSHIYDSFAREEKASTSKIQGTGLGMSIVKRLVDFMDGTIDIQSEQGKGTTVTIVLHLSLAEQGEVESENKAETDESLLNGKRVLLVEDNDLNREIATDLLTDHGMVVDGAVNGFDAIDHVKEHGTSYYDFVLMDIQMPMMDGYETTARIRKLPDARELPIIALSANAFEEDRKKSLEAGMNDHVSKPIVISKLIEALAKYVH